MAKRDLVYILRNSSVWQNNEIRYSIRSAEKNMPDIGKIFIVGFCPKFIDQSKIIFIKEKDPYTNKLKNAVHKLKVACEDKRLSQEFILMNDDFFILKKIDELKCYNRGKLKRSAERHQTHGGYYYKAIVDTINYLKDAGIRNPIDYEMHYPMIFDKSKFLKILIDLNRCERGFLFRSIYGNKEKVESEKRRDIKIYRNFGEDAKKLYEENEVISTDNRAALDTKFQKIMKRRFKKPSQFEANTKDLWRTPIAMCYAGKRYNPGDIIRANVPQSIILENKLKKVSII
jgi:hypothetical protein